jgi:tetratricopeptide (TPR) repeat protein
VILLALVAAASSFFLWPAPPASDTDARIAWYRARAAGPGAYPHHARLGLAYLQKARETGKSHWYDEAERSLRASLDDQLNFEALYGMGSLLAARHRFREALPLAEQAAASVPGSPEAQGLLFELHLALGDTAQAAAALDAVPQRETFAIAARRAALHEYQGRLDQALAASEQACRDAQLRRLPAGVRAWCEVRRGALLLHARCDATGAEESYQQALRFLPNYYFAREHLAELRAAQGLLPEAITIYETLLRDLPVPAYRLAVAEVYESVGRTGDARRERAAAQVQLQQSVAGGSREDLREYVLLVAEQKEHAAEALRLAESEWALRRDWFTADALAWASFHNGRTREAAALAATALASGAKSNSLRLRATGILMHAGRTREAQALLEQTLVCPAALTPGELSAAERIRAALTGARE